MRGLALSLFLLTGCASGGLIPCQTDADCGKNGVCSQVDREPAGTLACTHACLEQKDCADLSPCHVCRASLCKRDFGSC